MSTGASEPTWLGGWKTRAAGLAALTAVYFLAARLGNLLIAANGTVSPVWPAAGVALAALLIFGSRVWPAIAIGEMLLNLSGPIPIAASVGIAFGNTLECLLGAALYRRLTAPGLVVGAAASPQGILTAALLAPPLCAAIGVLSLCATGATPWAGAIASLHAWYVGDCLGILVVTPALLALHHRLWQSRPVSLQPVAELGAALVAALLLGGAVFLHPGGHPFLFVLFPALLLGAARLGASGAGLMALAFSTVGVWATVLGSGPFAQGTQTGSLLRLQLFLGSIALTALVLPAYRSARRLLVPALVLLCGWGLGAWLFASLYQDGRRLDQERLLSVVRLTEQNLRERIETYEDALRGGAALFAASDRVDRLEWRRYVRSLRIIERYPGMRGMGVVRPVGAGDLKSLAQAERESGEPQFEIHPVPGARAPAAARGDHFIIAYLEPREGNVAALGLDAASEPVRWEVACAARDSGQPVMSTEIVILQDRPARPGFLLFVPVYRKDWPTSTVAERRLALVAWIYGVFVLEEFVNAVVERKGKPVEVEIFDGAAPDPERRIYSAAGSEESSGRFDQLSQIELASRRLTLGWRRTPGFISESAGPAAWAAAATALLSLLMASLLWSIQSVGERAQEIALERTALLRQSEAHARGIAADLEKALKEVDAASRAKSEFLARMSHELRTPMNGVMGMTELLLDSPLSADQRGMAEAVHTSAEALLELLNEVLDLSKIEAGKLQITPAPFDLFTTIQEVEQLLRSRALGKGVGLLIHYPEAVPRLLLGDAGRIRQVVLNLVGNALKFTDQGEVSVEVEALQHNGRQALLRIAVHDTGIGIPAAKQPLLFQKFSQVDTSATRRFGGTGLGLAICKQLVELMGGEIGLHSQLGEGSTFWFTLELPVCVEPVHASPVPRPTVPEAGTALAGIVPSDGWTVLVAEDNPVNQKLAVRLLEKLGCRVDVASNGKKAIVMAEMKAYDAIFMDCQMPEMDGFEATGVIRLRESGTGAHTPIIAMTANAMAQDRQLCLEAGMDDYVSKPISRQSMLSALERQLVPVA